MNEAVFLWFNQWNGEYRWLNYVITLFQYDH